MQLIVLLTRSSAGEHYLSEAAVRFTLEFQDRLGLLTVGDKDSLLSRINTQISEVQSTILAHIKSEVWNCT